MSWTLLSLFFGLSPEQKLVNLQKLENEQILIQEKIEAQQILIQQRLELLDPEKQYACELKKTGSVIKANNAYYTTAIMGSYLDQDAVAKEYILQAPHDEEFKKRKNFQIKKHIDAITGEISAMYAARQQFQSEEMDMVRASDDAEKEYAAALEKTGSIAQANNAYYTAAIIGSYLDKNPRLAEEYSALAQELYTMFNYRKRFETEEK